MKRHLLFCIICLLPHVGSGQVLISLLLGDKLNTGQIEFGLEGGANFMTLGGLPQATSTTGFNLGFYFDFQLKSSWMFHTGVIVKSPMGTAGLSPYSLGNPDLDSQFAAGSVARNFRYFNVPLMAKYNFKNHLFAEGGIMLGLLYKAFDNFTAQVNGSDLNYQVDVLDQYHRLDAGLAARLGYRLMKGHGMNLSTRYYYGLVNISKTDGQPSQYNRSFYIVLGIPIGKGKAEERNRSQKQ